MLKRVSIKMLRKKLKLDNISVSNLGNNATENEVREEQFVTANENTRQQCSTNQSSAQETENIAYKILELERNLSGLLKPLKFKSPVSYVYNPLEYAHKPHATFTEKYCTTKKKILFVGMNPGPWGMCQTGVPFGEINAVREWFQIEADVLKPEKECPDRLIVGFSCLKSEVSGKRLWGYFKKICATPECFFKHAFVYNYCPLAFMKDGGGNVTPDGIKGPIQQELLSICDDTLFNLVRLLDVKILIGVGRFTERRCKEALKKNNHEGTKIIYLPHPSPLAFPGDAGETKWLEKTEDILNKEQLLQYFTE